MQLSLFDDDKYREKQEQAEFAVDEIRQRFGYHVIKKGVLLADKTLTKLNAKDENIIHPVSFFA